MRVRWVTAAAGLAVVAALAATGFSSMHRASHTGDTGRLIFDLDAGDVTIADHTARITWHLTGDNIVNPSVAAAWYSSYLDEPGRLGGRVVADFETGTVEGTLVEKWGCAGDCAGWTYRDAEITATITEGRIVPDAAGWRLTGTVEIAYHARGGRDESPSQCGNAECYVCRDRFCTFDRTTSGSAQLSGWLRDGSLALAFTDGLPEDVEDLDVSGLQDTEYFLSRFSATLSGAAVEATAPLPPSRSTRPPARSSSSRAPTPGNRKRSCLPTRRRTGAASPATTSTSPMRTSKASTTSRRAPPRPGRPSLPRMMDARCWTCSRRLSSWWP
jgi:hypothetical protein